MLAPWKKIYDQSKQHIKKQRRYFAKNVHLVKAMIFPVVMYGCERWTIKKEFKLKDLEFKSNFLILLIVE